jgi:hypothetical protein
MSKRSISIKKKILYPVLLGLVTLSSTAMATIDLGLYNGATKHYRKGKEHYSPVLGAAGLVTGLVENIRKFGPYTPAYKEDGSRDYAGDTSDNPSWQMVKILFPSTGGGLTSEANFETNFGNNVDKVQTIVPLLSFVNDLREGKDVNVEALKNALFSTLKERPALSVEEEEAKLGSLKQAIQSISVKTKGDFIDRLHKILKQEKDERLRKALIQKAETVKGRNLTPEQLQAAQQNLIEATENYMSGKIKQKTDKFVKNEARFKDKFFQETLTPLINAIQSAVQSEKDSIFPAYTTEQLIESFFSHKFNTEKDINNLIEATPDDIVDPAVPFVSEPVSAEEILKHDVLDMDDFLALSAVEMAGAPIPYQSGVTPITNGERAWFYDRAKDQFNKALKFSDCVDEMPRHMANMLLYNPKKQAFNMTPLFDQQKKFAEGSPQFKRLQQAIEFFTEHPERPELPEHQSPIMANNGTTETRSLWNRVIAGLNLDGIGPKVDYVQGNNELNTGHINMLRMFQNLFSLELDSFPVREVVNEDDPEKEKEVRENIQKKFEEDRINWILSSFRKVFSFMNPDLVYDFKPENLGWSPERNDMMGNIVVLVKKSKASSAPLYSFKMHHINAEGRGGHGEIQDIAYPKNETALEIETKAAAIEPLTAEESLWLLFPQLAKKKITEPLYQMMPRLLADNNSKINFISLLKTIDWQHMPSLATQEIAGFLSNILPTLGWDDPDTFWRITSSIVYVFLDKDENLNETVPQEVRDVFFKKTQSLDFQRGIKPNFARVLPYFQNDMLETPDLKIKFIQSLSGIDWSEVPKDNASEITGLLSRTLDTLAWDDFNTPRLITNSIVGVFLDKDEKLNETVPPEIREAFFSKTQSLEFEGSMKPNFAVVLPHFQNDVLKTQNSKIFFLRGLSGIDWKEISEENTSKMTGLLSKVLDTFSGDSSRTLQWFTSSIRSIILDKEKNLNEAVPAEIRKAIFSKTQSLELKGAIKPNFMQLLLEFKNDVLKTQNSKMSFLQGLSTLDWTAVRLENTQKITNLLLQVLNTISWQDSFVVRNTTKAIVDIFLDKEGRLKVVPQEIQEAFFNKTQSLLFESPITTDMFLGLNQILPRFDQAKDKITRLTLSGGQAKIDQFPEYLERLTSLTLSKVKVGTAELAKLPSLNNLSFEGATLDRLVIDPAHSNLKITKKSLSVSEIQGVENLDVFQEETLSSGDSFFNGVQGIEVIKFTNPNHKIKTLIFKGDKLSRIEGLSHLPNLHVLNLSGQVQEIQGLEHLTQLKKMAFSGAALESLKFFPSNGSLEELSVEESSINSIQGLGYLKGLKSLSLRKTSNLTTLNFESELPKLLEIKITENESIEELNGLDKLPKIESLHLQNTPSLKSLVLTGGNDYLKNIHLQNSGVTVLEGVDTLPNLETLAAAGAKNLTSVRFGSVNAKLYFIDLSQSGLTSVKGLEELPALEVLNLERSKSLASDIHFSQTNSELHEVNLSTTAVGHVSGLEGITNLHTLGLRGLNLESLELFPNLKETGIYLGGASVGTLTGLEIYINSMGGTDKKINDLRIDSILTGIKHIGKIVFTIPDPNLVALNINSRRPSTEASLSIGNIKGFENFENLKSIEISGVALHSLNFDQDLEKLESIIMKNGQLDELKGLHHLPALEAVTVPSAAPEKIELPEGVNFAQEFMRGYPDPTEPKIITFKRPGVTKTHEEND